MKSVKCAGCGANVDFDGSKKIIRCEYCGTVYKDESKFAKADPLSQQQLEEMVAKARFASEEYEERPKFSPFIFILLCCFGIFPIAIYWIVLRARQKQWDKDHKLK